MILYIEKKCEESPIVQNILCAFPQARILKIDNYKNIFDVVSSWNVQKAIVLANVNTSITRAPIFYGYSGTWYFLKNSLNCVYDCKYCYLQWIFKSNYKVFFVNYWHIKKQIKEVLNKNKSKNDIWFYSSDYSDNLATDSFTLFTTEFIPFFDNLKNAKMEIRTKSNNIDNLLNLNSSKNIEIAFSLSPQEIIDSYETGTPMLEQRVQAMKKLISAWWQVGIRFMPLIWCKNYQKIYTEFIKYIVSEIDMNDIYSIFIGWLLFTSSDYKMLLRKQPDLDVLYKMKSEKDGFYRQEKDIRRWFYETFTQEIWDKKVSICFDSMND